MEKITDSTSEEWIVDGDLYLIKTISRYPILWDRKNFDSDQRNEVWLKLSKKLNIKLEWLKKRWSYLREQYVRHLKQINDVESDKPSKKNYNEKFNEMSFLADHIQIRNGSYQDLIFHNAHKPTQIDSSNNEVVETENVDFVITETEIEEAYNEDDLTENLFVELSDEEKDVQLHHNESYHINSDFIKSTTTVTISPDHGSTSNPTTKVTTSVPNKFQTVVSPELRVTDHRIPAIDTHVTNDNYQDVSKAPESRCEDVIFGELVTSMLKRMDSPNRKRAKKEILNILLS